jgi:F0F1-type ATP synthase gamma subunit
MPQLLAQFLASAVQPGAYGARQAAITQEISEIVGGAESLKK